MMDLKDKTAFIDYMQKEISVEGRSLLSALSRIADTVSNQVEVGVSGQQLAEQFHKLYEELAPQFGYETREETKIFNPESNNGKLMITVSEEILKWLSR